ILLRSLFPAEEIERERGVIIEEIRMYTDDPARHVWHLWTQAMYGTHPLGRRVDGTEKTVSAFKRADFLSYVKAHYHTENAVVAVAGNFEIKEMQRMLEQLFRDLPVGKETFPTLAPSRKPASRANFERRATIDQTHVVVGVPGLSLLDEDRPAAEVLATLLGGGMSSRLFLRVREDHGLAYSVRTFNESYTDAGFVATQAGLRSARAAFAVQLILEEYDRLMEELVPEAELMKAKQMIRGHMMIGLEETNALALFAGTQTLLEKRVQTPMDIWHKIEAVTAEDVRQVAKRLLAPKKRALALLGPQKSAKEFEKLLA
ncbi:MAG: pitrilysin family protein, partial [Patescibacteria group bacterium]